MLPPEDREANAPPPEATFRALKGRAPAANGSGAPPPSAVKGPRPCFQQKGTCPPAQQPTCGTGRVALTDRLHQPEVTAWDRRRLCRRLGLLLGSQSLLHVLLLPLAVVAQHTVGRLHDHLRVQALRRHGQELVVILASIPGIAGVALKLLEGADLLGLHRGGRHLGCGLEPAVKQRKAYLSLKGFRVFTSKSSKKGPPDEKIHTYSFHSNGAE